MFKRVLPTLAGAGRDSRGMQRRNGVDASNVKQALQ